MKLFEHAHHEVQEDVNPHTILLHELQRYHSAINSGFWSDLDDMLPMAGVNLSIKESLFGPLPFADAAVYWQDNVKELPKSVKQSVALNSVIDQIPERNLNLNARERATLIASKAVSYIALLDYHNEQPESADIDPVVIYVDTYCRCIVMQGQQRWVASMIHNSFNVPAVWIVAQEAKSWFQSLHTGATHDDRVEQIEENLELFAEKKMIQGEILYRPVWRQRRKESKLDMIRDHYARQHYIAEMMFGNIHEGCERKHYHDGKYQYSSFTHPSIKPTNEVLCNSYSILEQYHKDWLNVSR